MSTVTIVIDMLNDFVHPEGVLYSPNACSIIENIQAETSKSDMPVIFLCDNHAEDDAEFELYPPHAIKNTWGAEIIIDLTISDDDVIVPKTRFSGFYETELDDILKGMEADTLILCGVCTNICVFLTAVDAVQRGYKVIIHSNQVASFDMEAHEYTLNQLENVFGVEVR